MNDDRGQALTLEAITAALILITAVGFALQVTAVTPLSASTSSQHLENQLQKTGEGVLTAADETDALEEAILYYNDSSEEFHNATVRSYYTTGGPPNEFGQLLDETYGDRNIAFNVVVRYYNTTSNQYESQEMVQQGDPSDHAVSSSRTVALMDDDKLLDRHGEPRTVSVNESEGFYVPNAGVDNTGDGPLYNLVRVEVIAWRL